MTVSPPKTSSSGSKQQGFTLIELLMVIAVILILAGITFGISRGVQNAQARAKAKAELAVIAQALEGFKSTYGDYPVIDSANAELLQKALTGWATLQRTNGAAPNTYTVTLVESSTQKKSFLDPTKLSLNVQDFPTTKPDEIYFTDPWGKPYGYAYGMTGSSSSWDKFGYVLFSVGPDGDSETLDDSGIRDTPPTDKDVDNIYAGE